ncbi:MAG: hypothetical protein MHM6MM_006207 [Cercozoa sp. M6MM]
MSEVEETLERIKSQKGVECVIVVNKDGVPIRPSRGCDEQTATAYAAQVAQLARKARSMVRDLDPDNELTFMRLRTTKHEIMIAPEKEFTMIVLQNPEQED